MPYALTRHFLISALFAASLSVGSSAFAQPTVHFVSTATASTATDSTATDSAPSGCFFRRDWRGGFRASPDARSIYIRVDRSVYRLDLDSSYSVLKDPFAVLINRDSSSTICTPLDFRLTVSNRVGLKQWPIVRHMTRLSPAEVKALPKKLQP